MSCLVYFVQMKKIHFDAERCFALAVRIIYRILMDNSREDYLFTGLDISLSRFALRIYISLFFPSFSPFLKSPNLAGSESYVIGSARGLVFRTEGRSRPTKCRKRERERERERKEKGIKHTADQFHRRLPRKKKEQKSDGKCLLHA